ncbi:hypothetical protein AHMF7605_18310 [Adhaeribacter arboris]|uniref:3D domain-containing protein n=1 Tax=Adhaeribacter arboris TaxID=2072846 RepID=A0A2T2YIJ8_9BACT|nr:hypothetical protein [Adhaeribacter arboris]PSR55319.1 hypothetical protein AHMF7605_18310 [Adhaeribacter arboris]
MLRYKIDGIFFLFISLVSFPHLASYSKEEKPQHTNHLFESLINRATSLKLTRKHTPKKLEKTKSFTEEKTITHVTASVYYPEEAQTDSTPLITADGSQINETHPKKHKWIAVSRNLLTRWGGHIDYGDKVHVSGISKRLDGVYIVRDTMKKRLRNRIDILVGPDDKVMGHWSGVKLTKL